MKIHRKASAEDIGRARRAAYPDIGDQIDAIYKGLAALRAQGNDLPADTIAWIDKVAAVKTRFPK